jgi:hypothetical protein
MHISWLLSPTTAPMVWDPQRNMSASMLLQGMHNASASFGSVAELVVTPPGAQPQASAASGTSCTCKCATGN